MTVTDIGPDPQSFDLEQATLDNTSYRSGRLVREVPSAHPHVDPRG